MIAPYMAGIEENIMNRMEPFYIACIEYYIMKRTSASPLCGSYSSLSTDQRDGFLYASYSRTYIDQNDIRLFGS
jgi:hypothetical protein